jgi:CTP:molybdopterin cytidylyltransferase MocA
VIAGILLAAGASTRMGRSKALLPTGGQSFLVQCVRTLWTACENVTIVLGSRAPVVRRRVELEFQRLVSDGSLAAEIENAHRQGGRGLEAHFVVNRRWPDGMLSSVREGLKAARALRPEALLVLPVDHPHVSPATVAALAELMREALRACRTRKERAAFAYALVPRHDRDRGHPLALTPALADAILADRRAEDLSAAVRRNARLVGYVDVPDAGVTRNRNTPRD